MKIKILYVFVILLMSCNNKKSEQDVDSLINSKDVNQVVEGIFIIGEEKNVHYVDFLLKNLDDVRVSNHYKFKGISVYQSKMIALKKISNQAPPEKITYKKNQTIIDFYKDWAIKNDKKLE